MNFSKSMGRASDDASLRMHIQETQQRLAALREQRDQGHLPEAEFAEAERELAARLLASQGESTTPSRSRFLLHPSGRKAMAAGGVLVVALLVAAAYYVGLEQREAGDQKAPRKEAAATAAASRSDDAAPNRQGLRPLSDEQLQRMVDEAGAKVRTNPKDADAWSMLAHSYDMMGKFSESSKAYAHLVELVPPEAQVYADYADALAVANGRSLAGQPTELVEKALKLDARNLKALALAGTAAFERRSYAAAIDYWQRAAAEAPDADFRSNIEGSIADAKAAAAGEPIADAAPAATDADKASSPHAGLVSGRVSLADDLVAKAPADATVFIFARPAKGTRMPVAMLRKHVSDLPLDFTLDDAGAMVAGAKLSSESTVVIGARVSMRGDVTPQAGDMQGWSAPVPVGTRGIRLEIGEVVK